MAKTIFVGNLPWSVNDEQLKEKFVQFGSVISARVVTDKFSGRSRGFGFVDMENADADKAIAAMTGYKWSDRELTINEAKPKTEGQRREGGSDRRSGGYGGF